MTIELRGVEDGSWPGARCRWAGGRVLWLEVGTLRVLAMSQRWPWTRRAERALSGPTHTASGMVSATGSASSAAV